MRAVNPFPKAFQRGFALSVPHKDNRARLPIDDDREKLIPSPNAVFIDRDNLQITQTRFAKILLEVFLVDAANNFSLTPRYLATTWIVIIFRKFDDQTSKALRVLTVRNNFRNRRIQYLLATATFQSRSLDKQLSPTGTLLVLRSVRPSRWAFPVVLNW